MLFNPTLKLDRLTVLPTYVSMRLYHLIIHWQILEYCFISLPTRPSLGLDLSTLSLLTFNYLISLKNFVKFLT